MGRWCQGAAVGSAVSGAIGALAFARVAEHLVLRVPPWTALGLIFKTALLGRLVAYACASLTPAAINKYQLDRIAAEAVLIAAVLVHVCVTLAAALALRTVPVAWLQSSATVWHDWFAAPDARSRWKT